MSRILVVEDHADLAFGLRNNLEIEGHEVTVAATGEQALERVTSESPELVVLDLMLPDTDGFRVLRALRDAGEEMPILILTARGEEEDKVRGLRLGADDYVTKPFGLLEFLARVDALLRRSNGNRVGAPVEGFGAIKVSRSAREVTKNGVRVELTPKEFDLLVVLLDRKGAVVTRLELLQEVWGYRGAAVTRTVDTHMAGLRRKLEKEPSRPKYLLTVQKVGYRLVI